MSIEVGAPEVVGFEQTSTETFGGMTSSDALAIIEKKSGFQIRGIVEEYILGISTADIASRHNINASFIDEIIIFAENDVRIGSNRTDANVSLRPRAVAKQAMEAASVFILPERVVPKTIEPKPEESEDVLVVETGYIDLDQWSTRAACRNADSREFDSHTVSNDTDKITAVETRRQRDVIAKYCLNCNVVNNCRSLAKSLPADPGMIMGGMTAVQVKKYRRSS